MTQLRILCWILWINGFLMFILFFLAFQKVTGYEITLIFSPNAEVYLFIFFTIYFVMVIPGTILLYQTLPQSKGFGLVSLVFIFVLHSILWVSFTAKHPYYTSETIFSQLEKYHENRMNHVYKKMYDDMAMPYPPELNQKACLPTDPSQGIAHIVLIQEDRLTFLLAFLSLEEIIFTNPSLSYWTPNPFLNAILSYLFFFIGCLVPILSSGMGIVLIIRNTRRSL